MTGPVWQRVGAYHLERATPTHPAEVETRSKGPTQPGGVTIKLVIPRTVTGGCGASCAVSQ
jgi:hypothetical protein